MHAHKGQLYRGNTFGERRHERAKGEQEEAKFPHPLVGFEILNPQVLVGTWKAGPLPVDHSFVMGTW